MTAEPAITGREHWTRKRDVRLFLWEKAAVPTLIMRGQHDGIAGVDDLLAFFARLPNPDKQFAVMPGIAHASFQQKNYRLVYHVLHAFFSQPPPAYRG